MANKSGIPLWAIGVGFVVLLWFAGVFTPYGYPPPSWPSGGVIPPSPATAPGQVLTTAGGAKAAQIWLQLQNAYTGTDFFGGTNVAIDLFDPADHSRVIETLDYDALTVAGGNTAGYYREGTDLLFHASNQDNPTNGLDYYDEFYITHFVGGVWKMYQLRPADDPGVATSADIVEVPVGDIVLGTTSSGGQYFVAPIMKLYGRIAQNGITFNLEMPNGVNSLATSSDGDTGAEVDNPGSQTADYTAASGSVQYTFRFKATLANLDLVWGRPTILFSSNPPYAFVVKYSTLMVGFNSTSLSRDYTLGGGFEPISTQPTASAPQWWVIWKTLPAINGIGAVYSTRSSLGSVSWEIKIDTTPIAASTTLIVVAYTGDLQLPANTKVGSTDGAPTGYGGLSQVGPGAIVGIRYAISSTAADNVNNQTGAPDGTSQVHAYFVTG